MTIDYAKDHPVHNAAGVDIASCPFCHPEGPAAVPEPAEPVTGTSTDTTRKIWLPERGEVTVPGMQHAGSIFHSVMSKVQIDMPPGPEQDPDNLLNDGGPPCKMCHGVRKMRLDVPFGDPQFGKYIVCKRCDEGFLHQRRIDRVLEDLPALYRDFRLDTFPQDTPAQIAMLAELCEWRWAKSDNPYWKAEPWLFLTGPSGHCKSGLMTGLIVDAAARGISAKLVKVDDLLAHVRATYDDRESYESLPSEQQIMWALGEVDWLGLDDLGTEYHKRAGEGVDWATEKLHQIIGGRHDQKKRTLITSNLNLGQLTRVLGHERTASRIEEACGRRWVISVKNLPNLRRAA